eukprot:3933831-Rhodomonas_salina.2
MQISPPPGIAKPWNVPRVLIGKATVPGTKYIQTQGAVPGYTRIQAGPQARFFVGCSRKVGTADIFSSPLFRRFLYWFARTQPDRTPPS